jgi:NADH-quinone oxidoreductase subunit M
MWLNFNPSGDLQYSFVLPWLPLLGSQLLFGMDGISLIMVGLSIFMVTIVSVHAITTQPRYQMVLCALFLMIEFMLIGLFSAQDAIVFFLCYEGVMVPMYICVGIWGGEARMQAAMKFFLYTFAGSILMLMAILYAGIQAGSFSFEALWAQSFSTVEQQLMFWCLLIGMGVKTPMWPLHTWLPDAHTQAPTEGSVLLAALLLKAGTYAMLKLLLPLVPDACAQNALIISILSLIAIIYVGILCRAQTDMKRLIAYASISHMGFVTLGLFATYFLTDSKIVVVGLMGSIIVMVAHAFSSGALFLSFGMIYEQQKTRHIDELRGLYHQMPYIGTMFLVYVFSTVGLPTTAGFVGEWMVILAALSGQQAWMGVLAATTMVISVVYMLGAYQKVFYGVPKDTVPVQINRVHKVLLGMLAAMIFILGLFPNLMVKPMQTSVEKLALFSQTTKVKR